MTDTSSEIEEKTKLLQKNYSRIEEMKAKMEEMCNRKCEIRFGPFSLTFSDNDSEISRLKAQIKELEDEISKLKNEINELKKIIKPSPNETNPLPNNHTEQHVICNIF